MTVVTIPGINSSWMTRKFVHQLRPLNADLWIVPDYPYPVYSPHHVLEFLDQRCSSSTTIAAQAQTAELSKNPSEALLFIGFSAGVVGGIGAARQWQQAGRIVKAFIAIDGWGVPLYGEFPIHRMSHDFWTHWSSHVLGGTGVSFYATPSTSHLELWRSPHTVQGIADTSTHQTNASHCPTQQRPHIHSPTPLNRHPITAAQFLQVLLLHYGEI